MNPDYIPLIRLLQEEFPVCERPFAAIAAELGTSEREVLDMTETLRREGALKRIGAALRHTRVGYCFNSMTVWDVPEARLQDAADAVTPLPQVTHCYARVRSPDFDYNLYTMVHETSEERLAALLSDMEGRISPVKFRALNTLRELKKSGMRYFTEEGE